MAALNTIETLASQATRCSGLLSLSTLAQVHIVSATYMYIVQIQYKYRNYSMHSLQTYESHTKRNAKKRRRGGRSGTTTTNNNNSAAAAAADRTAAQPAKHTKRFLFSSQN